jgi:hypothetical protein
VTCSSVVPGDTYTFSVYAADSNGDTSDVASVTAVAASASATTTTGAGEGTQIERLSTPVLSVGINNYGAPYDTLGWNWTASTGGSGTVSYFWSVSPTTSGCSFGETTSQAFTCASALAGDTYTFSVYAQDPSGDTSGLASITVTAAGNQTAPSGNTVSTPNPYVSSNVYTNPDSSVSFAWGASTGGSGGYTYYWQILTQGGSVVSSGATGATSVTDPSLSPGTYYIFNVYAVDTNGDSSTTGSVAVITATTGGGGCTTCTTTTGAGGAGITLSTPIPSVTVNNTPSGSSTGEMAWSWTPSSGGSGNYTYYWSISPGACAAAATTATSTSCSAMTPGVTYTFSVYAVDSSGTNSPTGSISATQQLPTNSGGGAATPGVTAWGKAGQTFATVGWTEDESGITSARMWVGLSDNCTAGIGELDLTYSNNPTLDTEQVGLSEALVAGQTYSAFTVVNGVRSSPTCVTFTPEVPAPGTPTTTSFSGDSGGATVGWSDTGTTGITTVDVETYTGTGCSSGAHSAAGSYTASGNTTSGTIAVVGNYVAGSTYSAKVTAVYNGGGVSGPGNCISYTVPSATTTAPVTTTTSSGGGGTTTTIPALADPSLSVTVIPPTGGHAQGDTYTVTWSESSKIVSAVLYDYGLNNMSCSGGSSSRSEDDSWSFSPAQTVGSRSFSASVRGGLSFKVEVTDASGRVAWSGCE